MHFSFRGRIARTLARVTTLAALAIAALTAPATVLAQAMKESIFDGASGVIRLQQRSDDSRLRTPTPVAPTPAKVDRPKEPVGEQVSEFEDYVRRLAGDSRVRRLGAALMTPLADSAEDTSPLVPPDYLVKVGDEIQLAMWGSVEADLTLTVERNGKIAIPRIGAIQAAGVRYADLAAVITQRANQLFRNFQLSISMASLRGQRVFVTGFVERPGTYNVNSLATMSTVLIRAGGPSQAGSFRSIRLMRGKALVGTFDFYDLLLRGDRASDLVVQPDDVIVVDRVGTQVGVIGSVNRPAVIELKAGDGLSQALELAGGLSTVADTTRLTLERLEERQGERVRELPLPASLTMPMKAGDVLHAYDAVSITPSSLSQNRRVRVEGEVGRPGEYLLPANSTLVDALRAAGGLSRGAYLYGTELTRESVRAIQQTNYDRAVRDLELEFNRSINTRRTSTVEEAASLSARQSGLNALIETMRRIRPTGRIVLELPTRGGSLPEMVVEDGDRLFVPPRPAAVGVFGSVYNAGSYVHLEGRSLGDYLRLAGGPTRGADSSSVFVVRANGTVLSQAQGGGGSLFRRNPGFLSTELEPGDTVFVPEEFEKSSWTQELRDWTQILYQFGIGAAGLKALGAF